MPGMIAVPFGNTFVMRPAPLADPRAYRTFTIAAPRQTHWRPATCAEVRCAAYLNGWVTCTDESTQLGQRQADFIRHDRTRRHTETRTAAGITEFTFEPGQQGYAPAHDHYARTRPDIFIARDGNFLGNPTGVRRVHANAADWADDFANHEDRLATLRNRG